MAATLTRDTDGDGEIDQFGWGSHGGRLSSHQFLIWMYQQTGQNLTTKEGGFFLPQYRQEVINAIAHMNALAEVSPGGPEPSAAYQYADLLRLMADRAYQALDHTSYRAEDSDSLTTQGLRPGTVECQFIDHYEAARLGAEARLIERRNPRARLVLSLHNGSGPNLAQMVHRVLSDRVAVSSSYPNISGEFFIEGMELKARARTGEVAARWLVRAAE